MTTSDLHADHTNDCKPCFAVRKAGIFLFETIRIKEDTGSRRKVNAMFAYVLLRFGGVPFKIHICALCG